MRGLDLFSGIGGISLALRPWVQTVAYCEIEPYCQAVLLERMQSNDLDIAPIWDDVTTLDRTILDTPIDIIFGGFPCQDVSVAGKQAGIKADTRSGLFFHIMRLVREYCPQYIFLENVAAICSNGLDAVLREIAAAGYDARWLCLSAAEVGAPHKRDRWWLLAYAKSGKDDGRRSTFVGEAERCGKSLNPSLGVSSQDVDYSTSERLEGLSQPRQSKVSEPWNLCNHSFPSRPNDPQHEWEPPRCIESRLGGAAHGLPYRLDRIKALGNSVVPQAAREAFITLLEQI